MKTATTGRRRFKLWPRFRLRTLFVLLSVVCLTCGWGADRLLHRRARAIALLRDWGLCVTEEGVKLDELPWSVLPKWTDRWLPWRSKCAGVESHPLVCGNSALDEPRDPAAEPHTPENRGPREPTPAERKRLVAAIATLPELQFVEIDIELDDEDLRTLSSLNELEFLAFRANRITGAGVAELQKLQKVYWLVLRLESRDSLTAEAVAGLSKHRGLELLIIDGPLTPEDVARVKAALPHVDVEVHVPVD
jgi:hypothetical protein